MSQPLPPESGSSKSLRHFKLWSLIGYSMIGMVFYMSITPSPPEVMTFEFGDKIGHLLAYGVLMGWFGQLYVEFIQQVKIALMFVLMGMVIEVLQAMGGVRMFEYFDMLANTSGILLGWWLTRGLLAGILLKLESLMTR